MMNYAAGCDPSGGGADEFAWAVAHAEGERVVVDVVKARGRRGRQPLDLEAAVADCVADLKAYDVWEVVGDRYAGAWVVEAFRKHGIVYRHSERTKSELFLDLLPLLTAGRLELPPDAETGRQAKLLQRRRGAQGKDAVDAPPGGHDDRINAAALAVAQVAGAGALSDAAVIVGPSRERAAAAWTARADAETKPWDSDDNFVLGVTRDW